ncbi:9065_t:CDS:1, partial [Acaulospora colombiana]
MERLKLYPPIMYTVHWGNTANKSEFQLSNLLDRIPFFKSLDLYISPTDSETELMMHEVQPNAEYLVLFSIAKPDRKVTTAGLNYTAIQKIENIICKNVRPYIEGSPKVLNVRSLRIAQSHIDNHDLVEFIEATSSASVTIETKSSLLISGGAISASISLPNLTTLATDLWVLATLFNDHVLLPNLHA